MSERIIPPREPGYYWVKFGTDEWEPAKFWVGNWQCYWALTDSDNSYSDDEIDEIGPKIEVPK